MSTNARARRLRSLALSFLAAVSIGGTTAVVSSAISPQPAQAANAGGLIAKPIVKWRADWWIAHYGVIYSNSQGAAKVGADGDTNDRYRPDCSGFVAMAWHLPKLSDNNDISTYNLWHRTGTLKNGVAVSSVLSSVAISSLQPGDAIVRHVDYPAGDPRYPWEGHVRLFDGWANASHTRYYAYEEYSSTAEGRRSTFDTPTSGWRGVRYAKLRDAPALTVTEYCTYQVTSGTVNKRSGNGTGWTVEGRVGSGTVFLASTQTLGSWRRVTNGWVLSGDGGSFVRSLGGCQSA